MSNNNPAIDIAALSAAETCYSAYPASGATADLRMACVLGVSDGIHRAQDNLINTPNEWMTPSQWNATCVYDAGNSSLPTNQQLPYTLGCKAFGAGFTPQPTRK